MPLRILVVPDKFKGTLTAQQAAQALAQGWASQRPNDRLTLLPMSDGGDGFGPVLSERLKAQPVTAQVRDAAGRPCTATWWLHAPSATAILESAQAIGLAQLPPKRFHPFQLDTTGLGLLLLDAAAHECRNALIGIGGSATNDAGFGMAQALGWQFLDAHDQPIRVWTDLHRLARVLPPNSSPALQQVTVAVDVQNPLLGPQGCSRIYGPQKGLRPEDIETAEQSLARLADVLKHQTGQDHAAEPGAGAAGGLGFGLRVFLDATLAPGFELFARHSDLEAQLQNTDLVLTGEGAIDDSTLMGKGVGQLARLCQSARVPCVAFAGVIPVRERATTLFQQAHALSPDFVPPHQAMAEPAGCLKALAAKAAAAWP